PTDSTVGWKLVDVTARRIGGGVQLAFRYSLGTRFGLLELDRPGSLYSGAPVAQVSERLVNRSPLAVRVGAYSLAQLTSGASVGAEVLAFRGGSDWRQDFRVDATEKGPFDDEGEIARFDDGSGAGWFLVG